MRFIGIGAFALMLVGCAGFAITAKEPDKLPDPPIVVVPVPAEKGS